MDLFVSGDAANTLLRLLGEEDSVVKEAAASQHRTTPHILEENAAFSVIVEGDIVALTRDLREALLLLTQTYYVFNQKPTQCMRSFLWFMCTEVLKLPRECQASAAAMYNIASLRS